MKVYIQKTTDHSLFEQARLGFLKMGYEVIDCIDSPETTEPDAVVVGSIPFIDSWYEARDKPLPIQINYPAELTEYLFRDIHISSSSTLPREYPFFVKPKNCKSFSGRVVREFKDLIGISITDVLYSTTILNFVTEYRCFVLNGELIGVKHYKGDPFTCLSKHTVLDMISKYSTSPKVYSLDVGVLDTGQHALVEVNNGYSTGNYGLSDVLYARFLREAWFDICNS